MKKIPKVNYIKVLILTIITILIVIVLTNIYNDKKQYERANDDVMGFLSIIKYDELNEYLVENDNGFIYVSSSADSSLDSFELELKEYILTEDLDKDIVYLDSSSFSDDSYDNFKNTYFADSLSKQITMGKSTLFAVKDGKIIATLNVDYESMNLDEIKGFIANHEVTE